jgi:hypothetical protein
MSFGKTNTVNIQPVLAAAFGHEKAKQQEASPPAEHEAGGGVGQKPEFAQGGQVYSKCLFLKHRRIRRFAGGWLLPLQWQQ